MSEGRTNNPDHIGRPSVCRNCGALVGASESACSACGAPKGAAGTAAAADPQLQPPARTLIADNETVRFARAIFSRPYIFTIIFIVANIFVFLLMWSSSGLSTRTLVEPPFPVLIAYGAKLNYLIDAHHEWWRFVTPIFVHIGIVHLLVNMYGLWMIGPYVERLYGSATFVVLWVVTGVAGVVASYFTVRPELAVGPFGRFIFSSDDSPSAGASGALFGLIGVLFVFGIKFRRELPEGFKRAFGTGLLPVIFLNLFIGFAWNSPGNSTGFSIGNSAHLGGLLAGALFGLLLKYKRPDESTGANIFWQVLQFAALALVIVSFVMVARSFTRPANVSNHALIGYLNALNVGQNALNNALEKDDASGIETAVKALEGISPPDQTAVALRDELKLLLTRAHDILSATPDKGAKTKDKEQQKEQLGEAYNAWVEKRDGWVNEEGRNYGIYLKQPGSE